MVSNMEMLWIAEVVLDDFQIMPKNDKNGTFLCT